MASPTCASKPADVHLTRREMEVLGGVCAGRSSKKIASKLGLRPHTIESYIGHVRMKLGAQNRCHMVAIAIASGLCNGQDENW